MNSNNNILLVEDDKNLGFVIRDFLELSGYQVHLKENGKDGLDAYLQGKYDIIIVDVMMPVMDGFSLAEEVRKRDKMTPIIFLTAKSLKEDRIKGFKLGADDYITKPFSTEELKLRIDAILRRSANVRFHSESSIYKFGSFTFNYEDHLLETPSGKKHLTKREAEVLRMLCIHQNKLLRREIALKEIWGKDDYFMGRSMDVYITKLRKVLADDPNVTITNIHNTGFKLVIKNGNS